MGGEISQERIEAVSLYWYEKSWERPCLFPDVGIDDSMLKYSGTNSNAELQRFSNELIYMQPDFIEKLGSSLSSFAAIPNAVGLGALVISMFLEIVAKSSTRSGDDSYSMFRRVFAEEKGSAVRDTMTEYVRRHRRFMKSNCALLLELNRLETQLSGHLTVLRNSMLHDGHMTSRGFKIWVNGAFFHLQMLIHEARLNHQTGQLTSTQVDSIDEVFNLYLDDLDHLLKTYKTYKISTTTIGFKFRKLSRCYLINTEVACEREPYDYLDRCYSDRVFFEAYVNRVFSEYEPINVLKSHFVNMKNNLRLIIRQHDTFTLPLST